MQKEGASGFFETVMAVTVTAVAIVFAIVYLRGGQHDLARVGIVIDRVLFLPPSPMQRSFGDYMLDIGLTYLIYPIVSIGLAYLASQR